MHATSNDASFLDYVTQLNQRFGQLLEELIASRVPRDAAQSGTLAAMTWYHLSTGGKRLRAMVPLALAEAYGIDPRECLPLSAAAEILHNATLVHDDLQDGDSVRRGQPTVWKRYGDAQSINCGDAMFFYGIQLLETLAPDKRLALTALAARCLVDVIRGQNVELLHLGLKDPSEAAYFEIITGKTGGLFVLPITGAAIIANQDQAHCQRTERIGLLLGQIFQVRDDLLDLIGDKGRNRIGCDIAEGKLSLPVVYGLSDERAAHAARLKEIVVKPREATDDEMIAEAIEILTAGGAIARAQAKLNELKSTLADELEQISPPQVATRLEQLGAHFSERTA